MRWHGRLIRPLRPYSDDSISVDDALHQAAADLWVEVDGRGFDVVAQIMVAAAEAGVGAPAG